MRLSYLMRYAFIGGIPASGKSHLAEKIAKTTGVLHVAIDNWREEIRGDSKLKPWVNFFRDKNEEEYWKITHCEKHWENLTDQSEAFWPIIKRRIDDVVKSGKDAIFEGVNLLPHLVANDFRFPAIFLLGESFEKVFARNKRDPRWGQTEILQRKEAEIFFFCERPLYKQEAEKYGFKAFSDQLQAEKELRQLLANNQKL